MNICNWCREVKVMMKNECRQIFIKWCADKALKPILTEKEKSIYYSLIVDPTTDRSHKEQTPFILRYVLRVETESNCAIHERFLCFVDSDNTAVDIANLIVEVRDMITAAVCLEI